MIGDAIRTFRKGKKLRQQDLADACGVSSVAISNYERGQRTPDEEMLEKIATALGVTVEQIRSKAEEYGPPESDQQPPTTGKQVRTAGDANRWRDALALTKMDMYRRLVLSILPAFMTDEGLVLVTRDEMIEKANLPAELVDEHWEEVLQSEWVEREGKVQWALRLVFPEE